MAKTLTPPTLERDGTGQIGRAQPALDPAYVSLDERSPLDLLWFASQYAKELRYYDDEPARGGGQGAPPDWGAFLREGELRDLAALVEGPAPPGAAPRRLVRPHLALFVAFLRLFRHPRELLNGFTRRHLEFYYEQALRLARRPAEPDRVHVLLRPSAGVERARLPAGTLLRAGKDGSGRDRLYRTGRELAVNRAAVARLSSAYSEREVVGIREAYEGREGTHQERTVRMLEIALGGRRDYGERPLTYDLLLELGALAGFAEAHLFMPPSDLHAMMQLERRRAGADAEWAEINRVLEKAGRTKRGDPAWQLAPQAPRDFMANLAKALDGLPDFDEITEVENVDDLYAQRFRQDVQAFIVERLFVDVDDFVAMMQLKVRADNEWREVNRILERAGRTKRGSASYELDPARLDDFAKNVADAIGPLDFSGLVGVTDLERYYDAILELESYFFMNAARFNYLMGVVKNPGPGGPGSKAYDLLAEAHKEKVYADRRARLAQAREAQPTEAEGFSAVLAIALGLAEGETATPSLTELLEFVRSGADAAFLQDVERRLHEGDISTDEWARVDRVVELAQRSREKLPEPVALQEEWLNLYAAANATSIGAPGADPARPRWKTFGQQGPFTAQSSPPVTPLGFAIGSPLLSLRQGKRTITLTLGFELEGFDEEAIKESLSEHPFAFELSTAKGWLAVAPGPDAGSDPNSAPVIAIGEYKKLSGVLRPVVPPLRALHVVLTLSEDVAPIVPPGRGDAGVSAPWPMLRVMLRQLWNAERNQYVAHYAPFRGLTLAAAHLKVKAAGLAPARVQNDVTSLNATKPLEPFGTAPAVGSRFYIGDPELVTKRLDALTLHLDWMGGPKSLEAHYKNYGTLGAFETEVCLIDRGLEISLVKPDDEHPHARRGAGLFHANDAAAVPHTIALAELPAVIAETGPAGYHYGPAATPPASNDISAWPRHLRCELTPTDFGHQAYPALATRKAIEMAAAIANRKPNDPNAPVISAADYHLNPPYTPKLKGLRVDYEASTELAPRVAGAGAHEAQQAAASDEAGRLFHVHPFGASPIEIEAQGGGARFLPRYDHGGELYIGIKGAKPPENLTLLFQMAEGSADPDLTPSPVEWSYLSGDRWVSLSGSGVLSDTTRGLIESGVVEFALEPAAPSTRLPGELYWLRAAVGRNVRGICDAVAVHAQAVSATFVDRDNAPEHYDLPLPPRSITRLAEPTPEIAAVEQPYASRRGRAAERDEAFYTRASERLRHKGRALTIWDYERLVLERFPELYKVKCLPASTGDGGAGDVTLVVIPDLRGQASGDPFEPKAPASLLAQIEDYLADKRPAGAALRVRNARYVPVKVRVGVRFLPGRDEALCRQRLNEALNRFLSPWAYDQRVDVTIGGKIFANSIINVLERLDDVDYVAKIALFRLEGDHFEAAPPPGPQGYFVEAALPDEVLSAAREHEIDLIPETGDVEESFVGINYMKVELDFVVAGS